MSEENNHNGMENGDVPEIELIIKVSPVPNTGRHPLVESEEFHLRHELISGAPMLLKYKR